MMIWQHLMFYHFVSYFSYLSDIQGTVLYQIIRVSFFRSFCQEKALSTVTWQREMCLFVKASWSRSRTLVCRVTFIRRRFIIARKLENYRLNGCHQKRSMIKFSRRKVTCTFPMSHDQKLRTTFSGSLMTYLFYTSCVP